MKIAFCCLLFPLTSVAGLAAPKFLLKSRSVSSLETATGAKLTLPVPTNKGKKVTDHGTEILKQAFPALFSSVLASDRNYDEEYWYNPKIHSLGNVGIFGALHAAIGALSSHVIDEVAYNGIDMRLKVAQDLRQLVDKGEARVLDMCCGVGMSTRALRKAFPDAEAVIGLDTSPQMVAMANFLTKHLAIVLPWWYLVKKRFSIGAALLEEQKGRLSVATGRLFRGVHFKKGNAEHTQLPDESFDLVTVMYAFHEAPRKGREQIIKEARRLLAPHGVLAIIDLTSDYKPSPHMLMGEPYVIEYQQNMSKQLRGMKGFLLPKYKTLVPGHLGMWTLKRSPSAV